MSLEEFIYLHNDKEYRVIVTRKKMRNIRYTYKDGIFHVSAPLFFVSQKRIVLGLDKFADRLISLDVRSKASGDDYIYILGNKIDIYSSGKITFSGGLSIEYKDRTDLEKKLKKWFLKYIENRHRYYEEQMGINYPYKVKIRKMKTRYGSNSSQTHSITYSTILMHYTSDVIDSVIVHELAHDKIKDHSKNFYNVVYRYCPDYRALHKRLRKGIFHD